MTFKKTLLASTTAMLLAASTLPAAAAGTASGTAISNSLDISYDADGSTLNLPGAASDSFVVDEKIDFSLSAEDSPPNVIANPSEQDVVLTFKLTNEGNQARDFDVEVAVSDNGDPIGLTFDATGSGAEGTYSVYVSPNASGGPDTLYDPSGIAGLGSLAPDSSVYIRIVAHIPSSATQDQEDIFDLTTLALNSAGTASQPESASFDKAAADTIWADDGQDGTEAAQETYLVYSAMVSASKSVTVASENRDGSFSCAISADEGGSAFIPGACLNYTITLSNDAGASLSAENFSFTDVLPAGVSFRSIRDNTGFDNVSVGGNTITGTVNSLPPGSTASVVIRAEID